MLPNKDPKDSSSDSSSSPAGDAPPDSERDLDAPVEELGPLPTPVRIVVYFLGWLLLLIGILGLALPGIQGILTIIVGAALLSLASEAAHRQVRSVLRRWPSMDRRMEQFRARLHRFFSRR